MKTKVYTPEEEAVICEWYRDINHTVLEIITEFGLNDYRHLRKILNKYDVPPRRPKASEPNGQRKCPKCGKAVERANARFCWYCGADVRSPKMVVIEMLDRSVLGNLELVTPAVRDEMAEAVRNAIKLLEKE